MHATQQSNFFSFLFQQLNLTWKMGKLSGIPPSGEFFLQDLRFLAWSIMKNF